MRLSARLEPGDFNGPFADWRRFAEQRMERAALIATDRAAKDGKASIRTAMAGAGLGRLGQAFASQSDLSERRGVYRYANGGFSASGIVYVRSRSERTLGAIESYTKGSVIRPVRSRWLWIPTDSIPRVSKRYRLTPSMWKASGLNQKIGPLVRIKSINGYPLLVVNNVGVDLSGRKRSAKRLKKDGTPRNNQIQKEFLVAFIGIPHTARAARIDVEALLAPIAAAMPAAFNQALGRI
jgi:hypothetical protein